MDDAEIQLESFIVKFTPEVAAHGRDVIAQLRTRLPQADVLVYDNYNALALGFAPGERTSDGILSVAFFPRWISLFFLQAKGLDDVHGLLKGSGTAARHIVLKSPNDLDDPQISALIDQALSRAKVPLDPAHNGRLIIKSISAKQRPRQP